MTFWEILKARSVFPYVSETNLEVKLKIKNFEKKNVLKFFGIQNDRFSRSSPLYEGFHLQGPLKTFLCGLQTCSDYVTTSSDSRLYNDTKIMAFGLLEKIGHMFLKKLYPHLPFESYFSIWQSRHFDQYQIFKKLIILFSGAKWFWYFI